jgi:hypothetical protein
MKSGRDRTLEAAGRVATSRRRPRPLYRPPSRDFDLGGRIRDAGYEPEVIVFEDDRGRAVYVNDPDGNVVELWTWDVAGHLAG